MSSSESEKIFEAWLPRDQWKRIPDVNIYPNASVFNRKIYTFGDSKEVYVNHSIINKAIQSIDELAYLNTGACMQKIGPNTYITTLWKEGSEYKELAVVGLASDRFVRKNKLEGLSDTHQTSEYKFVPLSEVWDPSDLTYEKLSKAAERRVAPDFDQYISEIRNGTR